MPTQADLDWNNVVSKNSQKTRRESNVYKKEGGIYDLSTGYYKPKKEFPQTGKRPIQDSDEDFVGRERTDEDGGSGGGVPAGYEEVLRDYVDDDNTAQQEYYLTKAV